jgi:hypothetical protein
MITQATEIKDLEQKLDKLRHDPDWIRRYRICSAEMVDVAVSGNIFLANELLTDETAQDYASTLIQGLIMADQKHSSYRLDDAIKMVGQLLDGYTFTQIEQDTLLAHFSDIDKITILLNSCQFDEALATRIAEHVRYTPYKKMLDFPEQLNDALRKHGTYLLGRYIDEGYLSLTPDFLSLALSAEEVSSDHYKRRAVMSLIEPVLDKSEYREVIIENGFIIAYPEDTTFTGQELKLAASHPSFFSSELSMGSHYNKHLTAHLWDHALLLHYVQSVPEALKRIHGYNHNMGTIAAKLGLSREQRIEIYQKACLAFPENLLEISEETAEHIHVEPFQIQRMLKKKPAIVWDLHQQWVSNDDLTQSLRLSDDIPNIDNRLTSNMLNIVIDKGWFPDADRYERESFKAVIDVITPIQIDTLATNNPAVINRLPSSSLSPEVIKKALKQGHFELLSKSGVENSFSYLTCVPQTLSMALTDYMLDDNYRLFQDQTYTDEVIKSLAYLVSVRFELFLSLKKHLDSRDLIRLCRMLPDSVLGNQRVAA